MDELLTEPSDEERYLSFEEEAATALERLSEELLESTEAMQSVATMTEPVLADAIAIAREILRKLKVRFGETKVLDALSVRTADETSELDGLSLVAQTLEHLLAWGRAIDASIMGDPSVQAAINAIGQVAVIAKMESLRLAKKSRDMFLADSIRQRMGSINPKFKAPSARTFGALIDTVERGMNRVLTKVQDISMSGAGVSHAKEQNSFMHTTPIAGQSMQQGVQAGKDRDATGRMNTEMLLAQEMTAQAEAARIASQNAARQRQQGQQAPSAPARPTPGTGRQVVQQARAQQQRTTTTPSTTTNPNAMNTMAATQAARMTALRLANIHQAHEEEEHHHRDQEQVLQRQLQVARDAAAKAAAQKAAAQKVAASINPNMLKGFDVKMTGAPVATSTKDYMKQQLAAQSVTVPSSGLKPPPVPVAAAVMDPNNPNLPLPPNHHAGKGMAR